MPRGRTGWSGDRPSGPRRGGGWHPAGTRRRTRSPRTTCCSGCGWASASRGSSMATSGRPSSRPASTWSSSRPPARLREDAAALTARIGTEVAEPERRDWLDRPGPGARGARAGARWRAAAVHRPRRPVSRLRAAAPRRRRLSRGARRGGCAAPGRGAAARTAGRLGSAPRDPGRSAARRHRLARGAVPRPRSPRLRPARRRGPACLARHRPAVVRLQLVRRRAALAGRRQHRPAGPRPRLHRDDRPRDLPGPPFRACLEGGGPRRWARPARELLAADQHARVPDQRGPGRSRALVRRSRSTSEPTSCSSCSSGPGWRSRPIRSKRARRRSEPWPWKDRDTAWRRAVATPP